MGSGYAAGQRKNGYYFISGTGKKVEELSELGFHLRVESGDTILFSNMDEFDIALLERAGVGETRTDGALYWIEDSMVIKDSFHLDERICTLTAVYNETKADAGIRSSMIPMYMVSPVMGILFLLYCSVRVHLWRSS